jgi:hypothetical protein
LHCLITVIHCAGFSTESKFVKPEFANRQAPVWPKDKNVTFQEAFHFAACVRRIGKVGTAEKKNKSSVRSDEEEGFEVNGLSAISEYSAHDEDDGIVTVWKMLACCDGLCGTPLGFSVKNSFDSTVTWLCCTLTLGGQRLVGAAERRLKGSTRGPDVQIVASDFDTRHFGYQEEESDITIHPKPIPEVIIALKHCLAGDNASIKRGTFGNLWERGFLIWALTSLLCPLQWNMRYTIVWEFLSTLSLVFPLLLLWRQVGEA